ncbi:MAG: hypothetical protein QXM75_02855 [Candidatus Diapherotrites archaeon]
MCHLKCFLNKKGQSSFELITILAVLFSISLVSLSKLPMLANTTAIFAITRAETLKELSKYDTFYFIESIHYVGSWKDRNGEIAVNIGGSRLKTKLINDINSKASILNNLELCYGCRITVNQAGT